VCKCEQLVAFFLRKLVIPAGRIPSGDVESALPEIQTNAAQEASMLKPSTQDKVKGQIHEVKGKIKEKVGQLTNDPDLEGEDIGENLAGKVQKKIGQVKKVFEKP
jgi:uncharacterized protein YjbJ (UPF0337 family)